MCKYVYAVYIGDSVYIYEHIFDKFSVVSIVESCLGVNI